MGIYNVEIVIQQCSSVRIDKAVMRSQRAKTLNLKEKFNNLVLKLRTLFIKRCQYECEKARYRRDEDISKKWLIFRTYKEFL